MSALHHYSRKRQAGIRSCRALHASYGASAAAFTITFPGNISDITREKRFNSFMTNSGFRDLFGGRMLVRKRKAVWAYQWIATSYELTRNDIWVWVTIRGGYVVAREQHRNESLHFHLLASCNEGSLWNPVVLKHVRAWLAGCVRKYKLGRKSEVSPVRTSEGFSRYLCKQVDKSFGGKHRLIFAGTCLYQRTHHPNYREAFGRGQRWRKAAKRLAEKMHAAMHIDAPTPQGMHRAFGHDWFKAVSDYADTGDYIAALRAIVAEQQRFTVNGHDAPLPQRCYTEIRAFLGITTRAITLVDIHELKHAARKLMPKLSLPTHLRAFVGANASRRARLAGIESMLISARM